METMKRSSINFADFLNTKILGREKDTISFETLIEKDAFGFKSGLLEIREVISSNISTLEFVFKWLFSPPEEDKVLYVLTFPKLVSVYADSSKQRCIVLEDT